MNSLRLVGKKEVLSSSGFISQLCKRQVSHENSDTESMAVRTHNKDDLQLKQHILTDKKRGTGGRSSFNGIVATVFGATGFLGRSVLNQLGKIGTQIIVPYRGDKEDARRLRLVGDLGQVLFVPYNLKDEESIRQAIRYSNVVINLVGRFHETNNFTFNDVHVEGAARIARISKEMGVETLLHVSALNNAKKPVSYLFEPKFLQSKALGEIEVRREFPESIIMRPAYMYGQNDSFLFYFKAKHRVHYFPSGYVLIPMYKGGTTSIKQPVFVQDVGKAIVNAIQNPDARGQTYQAVGPHRYRLVDLVRWIYLHMRCVPNTDFRIIPFIDPVLKMRHILNNVIRPGYTPVSFDRLELECHTDVVSADLPTLEDLGITLTPLEDRIAWELRPFRRKSYYMSALGEFPAPPNPPLATA